MELEEQLPEWQGFCTVCEVAVVFREYGPWHRDQLLCTGCRSIPRQRAVMAVLSMVRPNWRDVRVWEIAPAGPASLKLQAECSQYVGSHFWQDVPPGAIRDGVRCEDLEHPTFEDGTFDIVVSSDVFEHVVDVDVAHAQVARVLAGGGIHVWTTPQYRELEHSRARVQRSTSGLVILEPIQYHGDPVNADGAMVTFDWGRDLPDRVAAAAGMWTIAFGLESRFLGLSGELLEVFVSGTGLLPLAAPRVELAGAQAGDHVQLEEALQECQAQLAAISVSRSWRLTAPLRAVAAIGRRGGGHPQK